MKPLLRSVTSTWQVSGVALLVEPFLAHMFNVDLETVTLMPLFGGVVFFRLSRLLRQLKPLFIECFNPCVVARPGRAWSYAAGAAKYGQRPPVLRVPFKGWIS